MKRVVGIALLAITLVGLASQAHAQTIGFKLGMTSSKLEFDPDEGDQDRMNEFGGGIFVRFGFGPLILQTEVLAATKGTDGNSDNIDDDIDGSLKLDYIEVPITAMFELGNVAYLFAGPAVAFEVGCSLEQLDCDDDDDESTVLPRHEIDFGLTAGIGFHISAGPGALLIEGRHTWGLTNIIDSQTDRSAHNGSYAFFAGYALRIGNR